MSTPTENNDIPKKVNPLSRRPDQRRLVMAVRGAAGTGKSVFAASMAKAVEGRLCFFDTERKARLLPGADGSEFDAIEIEHPDELPEFIDWALDGEGQKQGYGAFALDSWAMYFGRKHRETLQAVRSRTGDPTAQPTADELQNDQMVYQEVLRRLCVDSGKHVVITDQIGAKGREDAEENEMGRVLPMTTGGLEYFVDVMVELEVRQDGFEQVHVARVVKSNSPHFPVGLEVENATFADFLARMDEAPQPEPAEEPATLPDVPAAPEAESGPTPAGPTLDALLSAAEEHGITRAQLTSAASHYCGTSNLDALTPADLADLMERLQARYGDGDAASSDASGSGATEPAEDRGARPSAARTNGQAETAEAEAA
ncbi:MAG: hypothetical protein BRD48_02295 [Bacteroidetes bacterium QS_9_68_14]|nr:MAG: hypothetical protein BRD48_02295 [Bacteroidetes bacterium QS_9_68_14]